MAPPTVIRQDGACLRERRDERDSAYFRLTGASARPADRGGDPAGGRDHWGKGYTNLFLGGGVKPGRVIGKTDETGSKVVDNGWKYKEQPMMDHVTSTIYSALGIDYSKKIENTPSGRAYEYQQTAPLGGPKFIPRTDIQELFV